MSAAAGSGHPARDGAFSRSTSSGDARQILLLSSNVGSLFQACSEEEAAAAAEAPLSDAARRSSEISTAAVRAA
jgi:hypothetical protein